MCEALNFEQVGFLHTRIMSKVEVAVQTPPVICTMHHQQDAGGSDAESLPSSGSSSPLSERSSALGVCAPADIRPQEAEEIFNTARMLALDISLLSLDCAPKCAPNAAAKSMRRLVQKVLAKHGSLYRAMVRELKVSACDGDAYRTFFAVAEQLFADGKVHWGRVVALYAFLAQLTDHVSLEASRQDTLQFADACGSALASYLVSRLGRWIVKSGGWDSFIRRFPDSYDIERKVLKSLLFTSLGLGLLAGFFAVFGKT